MYIIGYKYNLRRLTEYFILNFLRNFAYFRNKFMIKRNGNNNVLLNKYFYQIF